MLFKGKRSSATVRKIVEKVPDEQLQGDLERYRQLALEIGAGDAKIITADMVIIDERVRAKCLYPKCAGYGTSANCPPYAMDLDSARKLVSKFRYGIFFRIIVPSEQVAGPEVREKKKSQCSQLKILETVSRVEAAAFYDGYYLTVGFGEGPCKGSLCPDIECSALVPGGKCRHALKARSAMEAVGMDVYLMATRVGWDVYPIGRSSVPAEVPFGAKHGLVLIY